MCTCFGEWRDHVSLIALKIKSFVDIYFSRKVLKSNAGQNIYIPFFVWANLLDAKQKLE